MPRQTLLSKRSRITKPVSVGSSQMGSLYSEGDGWFNVFPQSNSAGVTVTPDSSLTFAAVYAARRIISTTLGVLPIDIVRSSNRDGLDIRERMPGHPVARCLSMYPNLDQSPISFKELVGMELTGWGNFYAEINWGGPRLFLHPLPACRMSVGRDKEGRLEYIYTNETGGQTRMPQSKVLHVPLLGDGVVGKSPITYARESIGMGIAAEQFGAAFFNNGLNPSGVLYHPGRLDPKARTNLRNAMEERHRGPKKAGQAILLEEGIKYEVTSIPQKDAQFLETRQFQILDVSRWFGVPPHMLGDASQAKWANVTQYAVEFAKYTMMHYVTRIEQEIDRKLLWPTDEALNAKFNIWALLRGDLNEQLDAMIKGLGNGIYTINEVLALLDRNPMESEPGNTRWLTQQYVPVERALNPPEPQQPQPKQDEDKKEKQTEETSDDEDQRSHQTIGEPRTLTSSADDAWRVVFRGSVGQVVALELKAMQTLLRKSDTQEQLYKAVGDFMDKHGDRVRECIGPCWQARGMMAGETVDVPKAVSRYVADVRHLMLDAVRNQGLTKLVDVWSNGRADQVVTQYMDVSRN